MNRYTIARQYVGSITENGEAFCFGAGLHDDQLIYLDIVGPAETLKTIRAKLVSNGRLCYLNPPRGRTIYLNPPGTKSYTVHQKKIACGLVHCILTHQSISEPLYGELSTTYLIWSDRDQAEARLGHHIHQLLPVSVREVWHAFLWEKGVIEGLIKPADTFGGIQLYAITLDRQAWTTLIQRGLRTGNLQLQEAI